MMGQMTGHREWPFGGCSRQQDDGQSACYMHQQAALHDPSSGLSTRRLNKSLDFVSFHYTLLDYVLSSGVFSGGGLAPGPPFNRP